MHQKNSLSSIILFLIIIAVSSCQKKDNSQIEIYTITSAKETKEPAYDSLRKEFLYAPQFEATEEMLDSVPLIINDDIICLDTISGQIKFSANAINKIVSLKPSMKEGIKFAICKNKKPLFTGYFWSSLSSYGNMWNSIEYNHTEKVSQPTKLSIYKGNGIDASKREKISFANYKELVQILTESDRIGCKSN